MPTSRRSRWGLRIRCALGALPVLGWGFLLGLALVRANASLYLLNLIAVVALALIGGVIVTQAFHRILPEWHKLVRLLVLLWLTAPAIVLGLGWGVWEQSLDPLRLVNATGATLWEVEGALVLAGLLGGTWTGWTRPLLSLGGKMLWALLEPPARFFESVGRGFLWLPLQVVGFFRRTSEHAAAVGAHLQTLRPPAFSRRTPRVASPVSPPGRAPLPAAPAPATPHRRNNHNGARVGDVIEVRCPYCFDIIKPNDPRGVKVCEVCHTPHHADCWAITGRCQVAHLNT